MSEPNSEVADGEVQVAGGVPSAAMDFGRASTPGAGLQVPKGLQRSFHPDADSWFDSAVSLIDLVCRRFDLDDLGGRSVLDVGCGTKITKALLDLDLPVGRYVGIDVSPDVISFLQEAVDDPRFSFHHLDAKNELYHPQGRPLDEYPLLPCGDVQFDLILLFSVFTHLDPDDFRAMLRLLRAHAHADTGLLFSLFVHAKSRRTLDDFDEAVENLRRSHESLLQDAIARGFSPTQWRDYAREMLVRTLAEIPRDELSAGRAKIERMVADLTGPSGELLRAAAAAIPDDPHYLDRRPDRPLLYASYSEALVRELVAGTGWEIVSLNPPEEPYIQHYLVCRPV